MARTHSSLESRLWNSSLGLTLRTVSALVAGFVAYATNPFSGGAALAEEPGLNKVAARLSETDQTAADNEILNYYLGRTVRSPPTQFCGTGGTVPPAPDNCDAHGGNRFVRVDANLRTLLTKVTGYDFTPVGEIRARGQTFVAHDYVVLYDTSGRIVDDNLTLNGVELQAFSATPQILQEVAKTYAQRRARTGAVLDTNCPPERYVVFPAADPFDSSKRALAVKANDNSGSMQNIASCYSTLSSGSKGDAIKENALVKIFGKGKGYGAGAGKLKPQFDKSENFTNFGGRPNYVSLAPTDTVFIPEAYLNQRSQSLMPSLVPQVVYVPETPNLGGLEVSLGERNIEGFDINMYNGHALKTPGSYTVKPLENDDVIVWLNVSSPENVTRLREMRLDPTWLSQTVKDLHSERTGDKAAAKRDIEGNYVGRAVAGPITYGSHSLVVQLDKKSLNDFLDGKVVAQRTLYLHLDEPSVGALQVTKDGAAVNLPDAFAPGFASGTYKFNSAEADDLVAVLTFEEVSGFGLEGLKSLRPDDTNDFRAGMTNPGKKLEFVSQLYAAVKAKKENWFVTAPQRITHGNYVAVTIDKAAAEQGYFGGAQVQTFRGKLEVQRQANGSYITNDPRLSVCFVPLTAFAGATVEIGGVKTTLTADDLRLYATNRDRDKINLVTNNGAAQSVAYTNYIGGDIAKCKNNPAALKDQVMNGFLPYVIIGIEARR